MKSVRGKQANRMFQDELPVISAHAPGAAAGEPRPRNVLLLQGLMGRLFRRLGQGLIQAGHNVFKVNFNGGDRLFWRLPGGIDYRGTLKEWPEAFREILHDNAITDVVLFGDCRAHHVPAVAICRELGVPVHVFEEGYIRPDWVTLELGGVNGHSELPSDPEWYRKLAATLPPIPQHKQVPSSFTRRALEGLVYNCGDVFTRWYYPHWENHRPWHPLIEAVGWARKLWRGRERREKAAELVNRLMASDEPYYLFPLQLASDAQIRLHSPFATMNDAIMMVLRSFAKNAPEGTRLVVKEHPLDNGVVDWREEVRSMAETLGIEDRVDYLGFGDIVPVAKRAKGMVTINSTSGTFALAMNVPVIALGQAIYDMADLTFQHGIDRFWTESTPPDPETFAAFRRVLVEKCLIPGGFFSEEALDKVVRHSVARLEGRALTPE
ncbi:capsule biosynthesis protein [Aurantiacibacter suaedae]|uniref:capsule biosynthesis protein n=1 Tax=Aurantiacibacter suaedae TaxID=2545755 RepID=UPI003BAAB803